MIRIIIIFLFFSLTIIGVHAQDCYRTGLDEGKSLYDGALKLKNNNRCDEAAQQFWSALRRLRLTRRCADLPMKHDLDVWEDKCINGITDCGYVPKTEGIERQELKVSPQTLTVSEKGGENTINVTTNVSEWKVSQTPSWLTAVKQNDNNRLVVRCEKNTETNVREGVIIISANTLQVRVTIRQAGISCYEAGMSESRALYSEAQRLQAADEKEEAARRFFAAFRKIQEVEKECKDIPAGHNPDILKNSIDKAITGLGYTVENGELALQPLPASESVQSILFDEKGGERAVAVTGISDNWRVVGNPDWCAAIRQGTGLTVVCGENSEATVRKNEIVIADNTRRIAIPVVQAANSCYENGMNESKELYRKAQAMQNSGNKDEAARLFLAAFKKVQETKDNCTYVQVNQESANQESEVLVDKILQGIENSGYIMKDDDVVKREDGKTSESSERPLKFYVAATAGVSTFGTYSVGKITSGGPAVFGADVAYFFKPWLGAGLKLNTGVCDVDFGELYTYHEMMTFIGPALYGRWEKDRFAITFGAAIGGLNWRITEAVTGTTSLDDGSYTSVGGFLSAGVNYMFTYRLGLGLNIQSLVGSVKDTDGNERNPAGIGVTLGVNFKF